jgi:hypothetical protein
LGKTRTISSTSWADKRAADMATAAVDRAVDSPAFGPEEKKADRAETEVVVEAAPDPDSDPDQ